MLQIPSSFNPNLRRVTTDKDGRIVFESDDPLSGARLETSELGNINNNSLFSARSNVNKISNTNLESKVKLMIDSKEIKFKPLF